MKKTLVGLLIVVTCFSLCACNKEDEPKLSDSCTTVLAIGTDDEGNLYELVGNQTEEYSGTKIELGIIKNNEWSVPLTDQAPFLGENGFFLTDEGHSSETYDLVENENYRIFYAGNGCFFYEFSYHSFDKYHDFFHLYYLTALWNGNNGKSYVDSEDGDDLMCVEGMHNDSPYVVIDHGSHYYANDLPRTDVQVLDMQTMEIVKEISVCGVSVHPYVDSVFAVNETIHPSTLAFYDIDGNCLFSLNEYGMITDSSHTMLGGYLVEQESKKHYFRDGQFTFETENANGITFDITVDKTGKLVKQEQR